MGSAPNYVITTVTAATANSLLTDLATVKAELGIAMIDTSQDTFLNNALKQISRAALTYCNRSLAIQAYQDNIRPKIDPRIHFLPNGRNPLAVNRLPLVTVDSVTWDSAALVAGTDFEFDLNNGALYRLNSTTGRPRDWTCDQVIVGYTAGFGAIASEPYTVPATPWQISVLNASAFSFDRGVTYANGTALVKVASGPTIGQYAVSSAGQYTFAAADQGASVIISYAYNQTPDDVVEVALKLIADRFQEKGRDSRLIELDKPGPAGRKRWWFSDPSSRDGRFSPEIEATLDFYRVIALG